MTRLAVISDIHGNSLALRAVLADLDAQSGNVHLIVLGDLVVYGPDPGGVLALLREREPVFYIGGNTDRYLVEGRYWDSLSKPGWQAEVLSSFPWTAGQLGDAGLRFLAGLPPTQLLYFGRGHVVLVTQVLRAATKKTLTPILRTPTWSLCSATCPTTSCCAGIPTNPSTGQWPGGVS